MYFAYWMVLATAFLPYFCTGYAKVGSRDNNTPRVYAETLTGPKRRADWAQRNHFEIFPIFAAAVIIASLAGVDHATINLLAGLFFVDRIFYSIAYITDRATLRSVLFTMGALCILGLFVAAGMA